MEDITLSRLSPGETGIIKRLRLRPEMNRRLRDLGLIDGTRVDCLFRSPWGSPTAFLVRGAVIAIRAGDASGIDVERPEHLNEGGCR